MSKTPTYHVMHMYRYHQGAKLLESALTGAGEAGTKKWNVPKITETVSKDENGRITITLNNLSAEASEDINIKLAGTGYKVTEAKIVTNSDIHAYNTFEAPEEVTERDFKDYTENEGSIAVKLPSNSVTMLRIKK